MGDRSAQCWQICCKPLSTRHVHRSSIFSCTTANFSFSRRTSLRKAPSSSWKSTADQINKRTKSRCSVLTSMVPWLDPASSIPDSLVVIACAATGWRDSPATGSVAAPFRRSPAHPILAAASTASPFLKSRVFARPLPLSLADSPTTVPMPADWSPIRFRCTLSRFCPEMLSAYVFFWSKSRSMDHSDSKWTTKILVDGPNWTT